MWASAGKHGASKQVDQFYSKTKEFTLCLEEITKNYEKQTNAIAANVSQGKQLAQSFAAYKKVAGFHPTILPIVDFLQKSSTWLTITEELANKLANSLNDKTCNSTKESVKSQTANLKAIKQKKRVQNEKAGTQTIRGGKVVVDDKKGSEQCAFEIEEMTMNSLYSFWESYVEYFEEGVKLMSKIKEGIIAVKKSSTEALKAKRNSSKKVFAVPLEELAEREPPNYLPRVMEDMLSQISKQVQLEGIFRVSGSKSGIDSLRESIDSGTNPNFAAVPDPHTVPSLFKSFLRMLPIPVIPYDNFMAVPNLNVPNMSDEETIGHLKTLVQGLPPTHYHLLGRLLGLCQKIVAEKAITKMNSSNIAVVLGPNLIRPPDGPGYSPDSFGDSNTIVQLLVDHFSDIYPENFEASKAIGNSEKLYMPTLQTSQSLPSLDSYSSSLATSPPLSPSPLSSPLSSPVLSSPPSSPSPIRSPRDPPSSLRPPNRNATQDDNTPSPLHPASLRNGHKSISATSLVSTPPLSPKLGPRPPAGQPPNQHSGPPPPGPKPAIGQHPKTSTSTNPTVPSISTSPPPIAPLSLSPPSAPSPLSTSPNAPGKQLKIIGKTSGKLSPQTSPQPTHKPPPSTGLVNSQSAPALNTHSQSQEAQEKRAHAQTDASAQEKAHARTQTQDTQFRTARPSTVRAIPALDVKGIEGVKVEIKKVLSVVVEQQLGLVRTKFAEVKSIPEGVPFIHVLKAITPELDKLKKIMPTPPVFEKLPDLPADANKLTRLKFTLDFALKDLTRVIEQVGKFVTAQDNISELPLLQQIQQIILDLHQVLTTNISKL